MLAKQHRLNLIQDENALIFKRNQSFFVNSTNFLSYLRVNNTHFKCTCIAPRKKYLKAVVRNFYKRQIFACVEELIIEGKLEKSQRMDLVLVLKQINNKQLNKIDLKQEIFQIINQFKTSLTQNQ